MLSSSFQCALVAQWLAHSACMDDTSPLGVSRNHPFRYTRKGPVFKPLLGLPFLNTIYKMIHTRSVSSIPSSEPSILPLPSALDILMDAWPISEVPLYMPVPDTNNARDEHRSTPSSRLPQEYIYHRVLSSCQTIVPTSQQ